MGKVVLATRNRGKIAELGVMLAAYGIEVVGLDAFPEVGEEVEDGATFEENARKKARAVAEATGLVAVADDSGLEVDALGGARGSIPRATRAPAPTTRPTTSGSWPPWRTCPRRAGPAASAA